MKLPHALGHRPTPQMPSLAGFEPCFAPVPSSRVKQPAQVVRPVYWWTTALRRRGDLLLGVHFDANHLTARVSVRLASYRIVEAVRSNDRNPALPDDVPTLLAEAVWRLGALGWSEQLDELLDLLRAVGLMSAPGPIRKCVAPIPGRVCQPDRGVRIVYWWALGLLRQGWQLHACGEDVARFGFVAEIPGPDGEPRLVVYPGDMAPDGTEAAALANHLVRLSTRQRRLVRQVLADSGVGKGRVL
ncbi:hypothetical protein BRW65_22905 [Mycobacterium paraffinicum]|uniref:Uncharacterized protein n=2 Tax=Mycobacteriaceae TaxID=1762 RepID=A0A1Q4HP36_9MYCO|nr:hypothetical protein A5689_21195 [Mycobacterium intracellulare subsp. yongonense]OJZ69459.1 hypothetical protein BRW65_22905 [Mycobacterium paraffinicum]